MIKISVTATSSLIGLAGVTQATAQDFPSKPLRIIVPAIAGSAPDVRVRQVSPRLAEALGQHVIVDNRPGANGSIAALQAAKAQADGHTLMSALINNAINDLLHPNSTARLNHELAPVVQFSLSPLVMVVHPGTGAHTLQEYLQLAKVRAEPLSRCDTAYVYILRRYQVANEGDWRSRFLGPVPGKAT